MAANRGKQLLVLLWKNWLFSLRSPVSTIAQLILPMVFVLVVFLLSFIPSRLQSVLHPQAHPIGSLPKCQGWNGQSCQTLLIFTANITVQSNISVLPFSDTNALECVNDTMKRFAADSKLSFGVNTWDGDILWNTTQEPTPYFTEAPITPNYTQAVVVFLKCSLGSDPSKAKLNYDIVYNSSRAFSFSQIFFGSQNKPDGRKELQVGIDRAFMNVVLNDTVELEVEEKDFPTVYKTQSREERQANSATLFLYCGITFQFIFLLYNIVSEKDLKLRQGLKIVGLKDSIYWLSWTITGLIFSLFSTLLLQITGYATQLKFFTNTDFYITFLIFFVYSASMIPLAFFVSVFLSVARQAANIGLVIFVVGALFILFVGNAFIIEELYGNLQVLYHILSFLPPFQLAKAMGDIGLATSPTDAIGKHQDVYRFDGQHFVESRKAKLPNFGNFSANSGYLIVDMPPTILSLVWLLGDAILYGLLHWYLDAVLSGNHGIPRKPYFFLLPSYWLGTECTSSKHEASQEDESSDHSTESTPLLGSPATTASFSHPRRQAMQILNLKKIFSSCLGKDKMAVVGLGLEAMENEILALLGHNGAGKSTTINMLTGLLSATEGDALLYGFSIKKEMDAIRNIIGVCPQHNVLWEELTAMEHMTLFTHLKGVPKILRKQEIAKLLQNVQLDSVAKQRVSTFSGGMKRRLSVALAFIGNPRVVFLDEPTTGMDPKIRRDIWNLILRMKKSRLIIMTTHSMEEADILGDRIAIMAEGALRDLGTSVYLKNKYAGYTVELVVDPKHVDVMMDQMEKMIPDSELKASPKEIEGGVLLLYRFPPERQSSIAPFFKSIEGDTSLSGQVLDYSISQTTLEEVFLRVTELTYSK